LTQLYSTASYQARDLRGIAFGYNNFVGGNFVGQNLADADFAGAHLSGANFREANLANTRVGVSDGNSGCCWARLDNADLSAADARGAWELGDAFFLGYLAGATTANFIWPGGHVAGIDLDAGGLLVVRDYDGNPNNPVYPHEPIPPIPITVDQQFAMGPRGTLRMVFEADEWDSTISFAPGIPVTLGGTLELTFAAGVNLASQVGRTFDLFDWTGVSPTGAFAVASPYAWDLSSLYTTGEVMLIAVPEPTAHAAPLLGVLLIFAPRRAHFANSFVRESCRNRKSNSCLQTLVVELNKVTENR
jgi:uncharacterized protein YjbI with pentapeptide repeats